MHYFGPVGEKSLYVDRALSVIAPFLVETSTVAA
jgi:hypothetical protein